MATWHAGSGDVVALHPDREEAVSTSGSRILIRADHLEVFILSLPAGKCLSEHHAAGAITIQCLRGTVTLSAHGQTRPVSAGSLVYLSDAEPHAVRAEEDAELLITLFLSRRA